MKFILKDLSIVIIYNMKKSKKILYVCKLEAANGIEPLYFDLQSST